MCVPQTSAVLCSGGCALLAVSSLLAIVTIFLPSGGCERRICTLAGYMQMAAGEWRCRAALAAATEGENRRGDELPVSASWQMFGSVALQTKTRLLRKAEVVRHRQQKRHTTQVEEQSLLGNQRLRGTCRACWASEGTERFRGCCKRTITPP